MEPIVATQYRSGDFDKNVHKKVRLSRLPGWNLEKSTGKIMSKRRKFEV
jgi:hypothetical protein